MYDSATYSAAPIDRAESVASKSLALCLLLELLHCVVGCESCN